MKAPVRKQSRPTKRQRIAELAWLALGIACLGWYAFVSGGTSLHQALETRKFEQSRGAQVARHPASRTRPGAGAAPKLVALSADPPSSAIPEGSSLAQISIPSLHLTAMVEEGVGTATLREAVGHIPWTALPGEPGNIVVAAHRDTFFRKIGRLKAGDLIILATVSRDYRYRVESSEIVEPSDTTVLHDAGHPSLTLVTCYPFSYVGSAPERFVVRAMLTSEPSADGR
jgi:sortase A